MPNNEHFKRPFRIKIQRQADWVAVLALMITLVLATIRICEFFFLEPEVKLLDPKMISVFEFKCGKASDKTDEAQRKPADNLDKGVESQGKTNKPNIELALPISLVNTGPSNHDGIVTDVRVTLRSGKEAIKFGPESTALFPSSERGRGDYGEKVYACSAGRAMLKGFEIVRAPQSNIGAVPLNVKAGSAELNLIWFIPELARDLTGKLLDDQPNRKTLKEFFSWTEKKERLFIDIGVDVLGQDSIKMTCSFAFADQERKLLKKQKWITPHVNPCTDSDATEQ